MSRWCKNQLVSPIGTFIAFQVLQWKNVVNNITMLFMVTNSMVFGAWAAASTKSSTQNSRTIMIVSCVLHTGYIVHLDWLLPNIYSPFMLSYPHFCCIWLTILTQFKARFFHFILSHRLYYFCWFRWNCYKNDTAYACHVQVHARALHSLWEIIIK